MTDALCVMARAFAKTGGATDPLSLAELAWLAAQIGTHDPTWPEDAGAKQKPPAIAGVGADGLRTGSGSGAHESSAATREGTEGERREATSESTKRDGRVGLRNGDTAGSFLNGDPRAPRTWSSERALRQAVHQWGDVAATGRGVLDLGATVRRIAQAGELLLAHRQTEEPAGDLLVLQDRSIAMAPFSEAIAKLVAVARASGRFQRIHHLGFDGRDGLAKGSVLARLVDPEAWPLQLAGTRSVGQPGRALSVLVVSDGLDPAIVDGGLLRLLQTLVLVPARVAWVHPWGRHWISTPGGRQARRWRARTLVPREVDDVLGVPVVGLDTGGLAALVPWLKGRRRPAVAWTLRGGAVAEPCGSEGDPDDEGDDETDGLTEHVDALRAFLTPEAKTVLGLAAGLPGSIDSGLLEVVSQAAFGRAVDARLGIAQSIASGLLCVDQAAGNENDERPVLRFASRDHRRAVRGWVDRRQLRAVFEMLVAQLVEDGVASNVEDWIRRLGLDLGLIRRVARDDDGAWVDLEIALDDAGPWLRQALREERGGSSIDPPDPAERTGDDWEVAGEHRFRTTVGDTQRMKHKNIQKVLEDMAVPSWPGVYVLGCLDRHVTIYSQQVRALNLALALVESGRVSSRAVVVGAGVAGLTCAAGLHRLGAQVTVLETHAEILPLFRGGSRRWLHPGVYEWPLEGWSRDRAGLPLLDWKHGSVEAVRDELEADWRKFVARGGIKVCFNVTQIYLGAPGDAPRTVAWNPRGEQTTDAVILAVGIGLEPTLLPMERRYWEDDGLDARPVDGRQRKWLVSGCGDGALADLLRLCIRDFQHERMLVEFTLDPRMRGVHEQILRIENDAMIQDDPRALHNAYAEIDAPWVVDAMAKRRRDDTAVTLNSPTAQFLTRDASALNRFLVGQLFRAQLFNRLPGALLKVSELGGGGVEARFANGTTERFDGLVRRHGPVSALTQGFPAIARVLEAERVQRRDRPTLGDQTRERYWLEGAFDALDAAYRRREALLITGQDTQAVDTEILALRREQRSGARLNGGESLSDGRFRLLEIVGQGGFGVVWKAYDRREHRLVALKVLHYQFTQDASRRDRLFRGARLMNGLLHPNVVRVLVPEAWEHGFHYYVMEYVPGGDLHQAITSGRLDAGQGLDVIAQIGETLGHVHGLGLVHRDVKPQNILLRENGVPVLTDFDLALAEAFTTGGTRTGALGTVIYAAPEQNLDASRVDQRVDVYGLAMTAVFCICSGRVSLDVMYRRDKFLAALPCEDSVRLVLQRALAIEPEERFADMTTFMGELSAARRKTA